MSRYHASLYSQQNRAQARPQPQAPSNFRGAAPPRVQSNQDFGIAGGMNVQNYQKVAALAEVNKKERLGGIDSDVSDVGQDQTIHSNVFTNGGDWNESSENVIDDESDEEEEDDESEDEQDEHKLRTPHQSVYPDELYPKRRVKSGSMTSHYETKLEKMYKSTIEAIRINEIKMNALQYEDKILHRRLQWIQNMVRHPLDMQ